MVAQSADDAVKKANSYKTNEPGMCLKYVRTWLGIASKEPDAISAWNNAKHKHPESKDKHDAQHPPKGAPVFWKGGQYGHVALAVSNDNGRSTDTPSSGKVNTEAGNWWRNNWGLDYLGWTEDLNGVDIPYLRNDDGAPDWMKSGDVYVSKLKKGQQNSQSVSRLRYRLTTHKDMPDGKKPGYGPTDPDVGADYGGGVVEVSKWWMRNVGHDGAGNGENWTNKQANQIFGDNYNVINE